MSEKVFDEAKGTDAIWNEDFKCFIHIVQYDFPSKTGAVMMLTGNCCSMDGAVRYFERINAEVEKIISYYPARQGADTIYVKVCGKWHAQRSAEKRPYRH